MAAILQIQSERSGKVMVRAKFSCVKVANEEDTARISLVAVIDDSEENKIFFKYTPYGAITLGVVNPTAAREFKEGKSYYVDFTDAG